MIERLRRLDRQTISPPRQLRRDAPHRRHVPPMSRTIFATVFAIIALLFAAFPPATATARAADTDRALLSTFCAPADIHGSTCKRAKGYPNAPRQGCDVTLDGDGYRGKFLPSGNPLLVVTYESEC